MANGSVGIGKIAGINIELHWMFILLIALFFFISPLLGLIWILLFVCVLIHELSHSITARRNGIKVVKIVLLPIGGASMIEEINIDPRVEFNIAIVGPIMSLFLGGLFGILVLFTPPGMITFIVQYLFVINIFLGIFNILPAFPMDGGRVLRSYLENKHNFYEATMLTAKAGIKKEILLSDVALMHGNALPSEDAVRKKYIVCGHGHIAAAINGIDRKAWLVADAGEGMHEHYRSYNNEIRLVAAPAFNRLIVGSRVGPESEEHIPLLNNKLFDFGSAKFYDLFGSRLS